MLEGHQRQNLSAQAVRCHHGCGKWAQYIVGNEGFCADHYPWRDRSKDTEKKLRAALTAAREKLILYRAGSNGEYLGGMEFSALIRAIDDALTSPSGD